MILVKDGLEYDNIDISFVEEIVGIKIRTNRNMYINVFAYYKAPKRKLNTELLKWIDTNFKNYIIMGDLNAHLINYGAEECNECGNALNEVLLETNAIIMNKPNEKTYYKLLSIEGSDELRLYEQTLDYVLCSPSIANKMIKCQINEIIDWIKII